MAKRLAILVSTSVVVMLSVMTIAGGVWLDRARAAWQVHTIGILVGDYELRSDAAADSGAVARLVLTRSGHDIRFWLTPLHHDPSQSDDLALRFADGGYWRLNEITTGREHDLFNARSGCTDLELEVVFLKGRFAPHDHRWTLRSLANGEELATGFLARYVPPPPDPAHIRGHCGGCFGGPTAAQPGGLNRIARRMAQRLRDIASLYFATSNALR